MTNIVIFGAGYVGFSLGVMLAKSHNVTIVETDEDKINKINKRVSPLSEPDLCAAFNTPKLKLTAVAFEPGILANVDFVVICVPTNYDALTEEFDTSIVESCVETVNSINPEIKIIIKSTLPVGFTKTLQKKYRNDNYIFSPEFLREGKSFFDNQFPSRIVVGSKNNAAREFAKILLCASSKPDCETIFCDSDTAEMVKLASNAYLATRVAFFNEIDSLAISANLNAVDLIAGICADPRIGHGYNNPSFGYGGYCLPKDVKQLVATGKKMDVNLTLIQATDQSNRIRINDIANIVLKKRPSVVGIFRTQMKHGADNDREAPQLKLIDILMKNSIEVIVYEPTVIGNNITSGTLVNNFDEFAKKSDIILANRWDDILSSVTHKVVCRDIYNDN